jgi:hypothetical protein
MKTQSNFWKLLALTPLISLLAGCAAPERRSVVARTEVKHAQVISVAPSLSNEKTSRQEINLPSWPSAKWTDLGGNKAQIAWQKRWHANSTPINGIDTEIINCQLELQDANTLRVSTQADHIQPVGFFGGNFVPLDFTRFNRHLIRSKLKRSERNESIQIYSGI